VLCGFVIDYLVTFAQQRLKLIMSKKKNVSSVALKEAVIKGMQNLKAKDIVCIDLTNVVGAVTDYFIISHGDSNTHMEGIAGSVYKTVWEELGDKPWHSEGKQSAEWMLEDYVDVVAHIFHKESRDFYDLEGLWGDAPIERIEEN
jgi:ribosome-associated protein